MLSNFLADSIFLGRLAQLVQSVCLTSRGSGVRIPQRPPQTPSVTRQRSPRFFYTGPVHTGLSLSPSCTTNETMRPVAHIHISHMNIAIIVAMTKELELLLPLLHNTSRTTVNDYTYHTGTIGRHEVTVMQCGIGKVNAAVGTLTLIDTFHPAIIINTGVAGGTGHGASIGDVVIASAVAYHDVWCGPGTVPGQAAGCPLYFESPLTPGTIERMGADLRRGVVASGDIFVSRTEEVQHILEVIPEAEAVDMESGAIAQVCHLKNIPFVCMRVISDTPGATHDNIAQYENFWEDAPRHTFDVLHRLLEVL